MYFFRKDLSNQEICPFTKQDFDEAIHSYKKDTKGIDCISCTGLKAFPDCSRDSIAEALNKAKQSLASHYQLLVSLNALLGKPNGSVRTVGKTPVLYRMLITADKSVRQWEDNSKRDYDKASAKSSALLAALVRNVIAEVAALVGDFLLQC